MGFDGFFLNSNNGKEIRLEDLQNLKSSEVAQNTEIQKIFNIFDTDKNGELETKNVRGDNELKSLFQSLLQASGNDGVLQDSEIDQWLKGDDKFNGVSVNNFKIFIHSLLPTLQVSSIEEVATTEAATDDLISSLQVPTNIFVNDEIAQNYFLNDFAEYCDEAQEIYDNLNMGAISSALDGIANLDEENLSSQRLKESIDSSRESLSFMARAKAGTLTKYEYYKESREHLKEILMNHVKLHRTLIEDMIAEYNSVDFRTKIENLDYNDVEEYINNYIDNFVNGLTFEQLKRGSWDFLSLDNAQEEEFFKEHLQEPLYDALLSCTGDDGKSIICQKSCIEDTLSESEKTELMTFKEVYQYEQGVEYSRENLSNYVVAKTEMETVLNSHNRVELFRQAVTEISANYNFVQKVEDFVGFLNNYYAISPESGVQDLEEVIQANGINAEVRLNDDNTISLEIKNIETLLPYQNKNQSMTQDGFRFNFSFSNLPNEEISKNIDINIIIDGMLKLQEERLKNMLKCNSPNGDLNEYLQMYNACKEQVIGKGGVLEGNLVKFAQETSDRCSMRFEEIKSYASTASWVGMFMTCLGSAMFIFLPTAGGGLKLISAGGKIVISSMLIENALSLTEAHTREVTSDEEINQAWKMAGLSAAGMVIGGFAGKMADKVFVKALGADLTKTLTSQLTSGSTKAALRTIAKPENLQKFILATGGKMSTDLSISLTGDLVLAGVLDTGEDWRTLLKSNLIGVAIGTASDVGQIGKMVQTGRTASPSVDIEADSSQVRVNDDGTVVRIQLHSLPLSRGKRGRRTVQCQIPQSQIH